MELMLLVECENQVTVPVNIGYQLSEASTGTRVCIIKKLRDEGGTPHLYLVNRLDENGIDVLQTYLDSIDRKKWCSFYRDQIRIKPKTGQSLILVQDVIHYESHRLEMSFWDALARLTTTPYRDYSAKDILRSNFTLYYEKGMSDKNRDRVITANVVAFHDSFLASNEQECHVRLNDDEVLYFIATNHRCVI